MTKAELLQQVKAMETILYGIGKQYLTKEVNIAWRALESEFIVFRATVNMMPDPPSKDVLGY